MQRTLHTGRAEVVCTALVAELEAESCRSPAMLARLWHYAAKTSQLHVTQQKDFGLSVLDGRAMVWSIDARGLGSIASWEGQVYVRVRRNAAFLGISVVCATHRVTPRSDPRKSCCHARPMVPSSSSGSAVNILLLGRPLCRSEAPSAQQNRGLSGRTGGLRSGTSAKNLNLT